MKNRKHLYLLALLPFMVVAFMYEIIPLIMVVINSFQSDTGGGFTLENYKTVSGTLLYQMAITNSLKISLISAGIGILIAFLGARAVMNVHSRFRRVFMTILNMVSNFSGIPLAFAYMILLGNAGIIVQLGRTMGWDALANYNLYTSNGLAMVYVYFQIPLSTLLLIPAFNAVRKEWKEAAMLLGSGSTGFWLKVGIPVLMPSILDTFSILFANALAAYATVYAIMMNSISLLPIQIAGCFVGEVKIQRGLGGALSVIMMLIMVIMILLTNVISKRFQKGVVKK
ncbi:MAG: ABC transporter permease subunit [Lachnospiraceae bacterium]|nr:ABC transporter permease subunit [Lachnospiraceae bacterium]